MLPAVPCPSCASEMYAYVTGIPASCICATHESDTVASIPSKPGKPTWPLASWMTLPSRSVMGPLGLITGSTYLAPKRPLKPAYPPGSSGSRSGRPWLAAEHTVEVWEQWMPMPTKSAKAWPGLVATSAASGEPAPKTVGMSIAVFSRIVFAVATAPKSQPARVYGTHGAGAILPFSLIISGVVSNGGVLDCEGGVNTGAVQ